MPTVFLQVHFSSTVSKVGAAVKDDLKLGALYFFLILFTPKENNMVTSRDTLLGFSRWVKEYQKDFDVLSFWHPFAIHFLFFDDSWKEIFF